MAVAFGTKQEAYSTTTSTITISSWSPASAGVAVAIVNHNQSGITNTGVSSTVDGAYTSSGTRVANGSKIGTCWQLQSLSTSTQNVSATFNDTWGSSAHLVVYPATGAHASSAFGDYTTGTGTSTTPSITVPNFASGDGAVDAVIGTDNGTISQTGNNTLQTWSNTTGIPEFGSANTTDGVMSHSAQFSASWAQCGIRIIQSAGGGGGGYTQYISLMGCGTK